MDLFDKSIEIEFLNNVQSRILKSAASGLGFKEKGLENILTEIAEKNLSIKNAEYDQFGGLDKIYHFLKSNPSKSKTSFPSESRVTLSENGKYVNIHSNTLIDYLRTNFNDEQLKNIKNIELKTGDLISNKTQSDQVEVPNSDIVTSSFAPLYPYASVGEVIRYFSNCNGGGQGSGFMITPYVALTNAHVLFEPNCPNGGSIAETAVILPGLIRTNGGGGIINVFGDLTSTSNIFNSAYITNQVYELDYAALRGSSPLVSVPYLELGIDYSENEVILAGFPKEDGQIGMWRAQDDAFRPDPRPDLLYYFINAREGNSGGPVFDAYNSVTIPYVKAIHAGHYGILQSRNGIGLLLNQLNGIDIATWAQWAPTLNMRLPTPANNVTYNLVLIPAFEAIAERFKFIDIYGNEVNFSGGVMN